MSKQRGFGGYTDSFFQTGIIYLGAQQRREVGKLWNIFQDEAVHFILQISCWYEEYKTATLQK